MHRALKVYGEYSQRAHTGRTKDTLKTHTGHTKGTMRTFKGHTADMLRTHRGHAEVTTHSLTEEKQH